MKARDAVTELERSLTAARALIAGAEFAAVGELCEQLIWTPQFEGAAELIAMMLLDEHSDSPEAREVVAGVLVTLGRYEDAQLVSSGGRLPDVDEDEERVLDRLAKRTKDSFDAIQRHTQKKK